MLSDLHESDLIDKIKNGSTEAFTEFVRRYEKPVSAVIIGMLGNTEAAEEIAQDVFIKFYTTASRFRKESGVKTYLTRIAINLSLNELKRQKRYKNRFVKEEYPGVDIKAANADNADSYDLREAIEKALLQLDPKNRVVVILRLIEGYSTEETAKILSIPKGTVLSRLYRGQEQLRIILKDLI